MGGEVRLPTRHDCERTDVTWQAIYNTLVSSIVLGGIYSLVVVGYVVVYRASHVFNFVHPQFMLVGALLFSTIAGSSILGFALGAIVSMLAVSVAGGLLYLAVVHRSAGQPHWIQMILTMGLGIAGLNFAQLVWGAGFRFVDLPVTRVAWGIPGGAVVPNTDVILLVVSATLGAVLYWILVRSPLGVRLKATAEDPQLAAYSGVRLGLWFSVAWAIAAAAAVVGGIGYASRVVLDPALAEVGLLAFPGAMIGGMDSIKGAYVGALILALTQQFASLFWGAQTATPVAFSLVLVVLIFRPRGLFGAPVVERV